MSIISNTKIIPLLPGQMITIENDTPYDSKGAEAGPSDPNIEVHTTAIGPGYFLILREKEKKWNSAEEKVRKTVLIHFDDLTSKKMGDIWKKFSNKNNVHVEIYGGWEENIISLSNGEAILNEVNSSGIPLENIQTRFFQKKCRKNMTDEGIKKDLLPEKIKHKKKYFYRSIQFSRAQPDKITMGKTNKEFEQKKEDWQKDRDLYRAYKLPLTEIKI